MAMAPKSLPEISEYDSALRFSLCQIAQVRSRAVIPGQHSKRKMNDVACAMPPALKACWKSSASYDDGQIIARFKRWAHGMPRRHARMLMLPCWVMQVLVQGLGVPHPPSLCRCIRHRVWHRPEGGMLRPAGTMSQSEVCKWVRPARQCAVCRKPPTSSHLQIYTR